MKRISALLYALVGASALWLAACAANPPAAPANPTPEPAEPTPTAGPAPVEKTVYVGPSLVDCTGVAPQKCMQVKEDPDGEYSLFYGQIEGFDYVEGSEYELIVREEKIENPPADAPNFKWVLVEVVSQTPVQAAPTPAGEPPSAGQIYTLDWYLNSSGEQTAVLPQTEITAEFMGDQVAGSSGCNRYTASITVNENYIEVGPIASTMMACPEPIMKQEQEYLQRLQNAVSFIELDGVLTIADSLGVTTLSFSTVQPLSLTGTYWQATGYNNGKGGFSSLLAGTQVSAVFNEDGKVSGSAGCNTYNATYQLDGDKITIGPAATTRMFCGEPAGIMEQETAYLQALGKAASYQIQGEVLSLFDAEGTRQVEYQANRLIGQVWQLAEIQYMNDTSKTPLDPAQYTVEFLADGALNIKADCNNASGTYTVAEPSLSIVLGPMTLAACPPESLSDEFVKNLGIAASYLFEGDDLFIATQMDVAIMKFSPAP
jgi:heat shock protein HslJ